MEINQPTQEIKTFLIEDIPDEGFELLEKLLPEWERTTGEELKYGYRTDINDKSWRLSIDPTLKRVGFSEEKPTLMSPRFGMRNVKTVEMDEQSGQIDFIHKSGIIYRVSQQGLNHTLISPDGEVVVSRSL